MGGVAAVKGGVALDRPQIYRSLRQRISISQISVSLIRFNPWMPESEIESTGGFEEIIR